MRNIQILTSDWTHASPWSTPTQVKWNHLENGLLLFPALIKFFGRYSSKCRGKDLSLFGQKSGLMKREDFRGRVKYPPQVTALTWCRSRSWWSPPRRCCPHTRGTRRHQPPPRHPSWPLIGQRVVTWPEHWPLIGQDRSREISAMDMITYYLWCQYDHFTGNFITLTL